MCDTKHRAPLISFVMQLPKFVLVLGLLVTTVVVNLGGTSVADVAFRLNSFGLVMYVVKWRLLSVTCGVRQFLKSWLHVIRWSLLIRGQASVVLITVSVIVLQLGWKNRFPLSNVDFRFGLLITRMVQLWGRFGAYVHT